MSGRGLWFQCAVQLSMVSVSSATLVKLLCLRALRVRMENQPSTRFSHEALVGV